MDRRQKLQERYTNKTIFSFVALGFAIILILNFLVTASDGPAGEQGGRAYLESGVISDSLVVVPGAVASEGYVPPSAAPSLLAGQPPAFLWDALAVEGVSASVFTQPKVADLDRDGNKEIISALRATCFGGPQVNQGVYVWDSAGNLKPGFPVFLDVLDDPMLCGYLGIVAIGDVAGDQNLEIVVATGRSLEGGGIFVISHTGEILSQLESERAFSGWDLKRAVLSDLDNDEKMDIVASDFSDSDIYFESPARLYAWKGSGALFPGWPQIAPPDFELGQPAIADLDNDGEKEIIAALFSQDAGGEKAITAFNLDGTIQWKKQMNMLRFGYGSAIVSDLDNNGAPEIIYLVSDNDNNDHKLILVLDNNGNVRTLWSIGIIATGVKVSVGDLNNDGQMEIIYHDTNKVYAADFRGNLLSGFPRYIWDGEHPNQENACSSADPPPYCSLTTLGVADLDGDGFADIYGQARTSYIDGSEGAVIYSIFAFNHQAKTLPGFPYHMINYQPIPAGVGTFAEIESPTYADLTADGIAEMVAQKGWGRLEALTLYTPHIEKNAFFPQYGVDEQNTKFVKRSHLECVANTCAVVSGPGTNDCLIEGAACGEAHLECVNNACTVVEGAGANRCFSEGTSCSTTRLACVNNACTVVEGAGANECFTEGSACQSTTCSDSDGGANDRILGTVSGFNHGVPYSWTDYCRSSTTLNEYWCNGNSPDQVGIMCYGSRVCIDGKCVLP